jgi:hypothetical protein
MHLQRPEPPQQPVQHDPVLVRRVLFAVGLVAVAVLAGFLWWLIRYEPEPEPVGRPQAGGVPSEQAPDGTTAQPTTKPAPTVQAGRFEFEGLAPHHMSESCDKASYGKVRSWLEDHPCERVVRGLYATRADDARAMVSISVVTMPTEADAQQLKKLTDTSGTGNVSDLLRDGTVQVPGAPEVAGGNYESSATGNAVTIIESAFFGDTKNQALLDEITAQALQVAATMR